MRVDGRRVRDAGSGGRAFENQRVELIDGLVLDMSPVIDRDKPRGRHATSAPLVIEVALSSREIAVYGGGSRYAPQQLQLPPLPVDDLFAAVF